MALTKLHVQDVCMADSQCKYICWETIDGASVPLCLKHAPSYYQQVRRDMNMYGVNLDERSDNCSGYILLKYVPQGYDIKK
jgi:hypothetical protein